MFRRHPTSRLTAYVTVLFLTALAVLLILRVWYPNAGGQAVQGVQIDVPDVRGLTYQEAQRTATSQGLQLTSQNGTVGLISDQSPRPHDRGKRGDTIVVRMDPTRTQVESISLGGLLCLM